MKNVRSLTEGAILLAAFAVFLLITIYIPPLSVISVFFLPLPFIMYSAKYSLKNIAIFFIAAIIISFITSSLQGLGLMALFGAAGAVMGYMTQKTKSRSAILMGGTLIFIAGLVISYVVLVTFMNINFIQEFKTMMDQSMQQSEDMLKVIGNKEQMKLLQEQNANLIKNIKELAPAYLITVAVVYALITQWICFPIVKRFGIGVPSWGKFRNLSLPKSLLWFYLAALGGYLLFRPEEGTYLYLVIVNARFILELLLLLQGLACLLYILHQRSIGKGVAVFVVILSFILPIVHYIISVLGIADLGFDFRKRFEKKE
ncbi:YybS family protein [Neobacillus cucumis]|uniref:YybS family protein n=1 Tax=Neobacillus cucumis TaxID=1740721 RepID=UPI0028536779|nr:YybS family protein [Neobacillus cucumis]MDR4950220.1 YybS family protein [Neobacillus cucumis]